MNDAVGQAVTGITTTINADGSYTLSGLETPATYRLTLSAEGYTPQTLITELDGGADAIVNTRQLLADAGSVRGLVTSNDAPLGGVKVELYIGETVLETTTPTSGAGIGVYEFEGLFRQRPTSSSSVPMDSTKRPSRSNSSPVLRSPTPTSNCAVVPGHSPAPSAGQRGRSEAFT